MIRTYEYRCLPQKGQEKRLLSLLGMTRGLYNAALQERIDCYKRTGRGVSYYDQCKSLTEIRSFDEGWREQSAQIGRGALTRLDKAFKAFFKGFKEGCGFPRFKGRNRWRSIDLEKVYRIEIGNGNWRFLSFKGINGRLRVYFHRPLPAEARQKYARLVRDAKGWKLQLVLELPDAASVPVSDMMGIDVGLTHFLTTDTGEQIPNPRCLQRELKRLRVAQRSLARKQRGSGNRERQRKVVERLHLRVRNQRANFHWQAAKKLVEQGKTLIVEDLNVKGLARGMLSRQVSDVGWAAFIERLTCKAESAGLAVIKVDPKQTTQMCSGCGAIVKKSLAVRVHSCPECGLVMDRDRNAAVNIKKRGGNAPLGAKLGVAPVCPQVHVMSCI